MGGRRPGWRDSPGRGAGTRENPDLRQPLWGKAKAPERGFCFDGAVL